MRIDDKTFLPGHRRGSGWMGGEGQAERFRAVRDQQIRGGRNGHAVRGEPLDDVVRQVALGWCQQNDRPARRSTFQREADVERVSGSERPYHINLATAAARAERSGPNGVGAERLDRSSRQGRGGSDRLAHRQEVDIEQTKRVRVDKPPLSLPIDADGNYPVANPLKDDRVGIGQFLALPEQAKPKERSHHPGIERGELVSGDAGDGVRVAALQQQPAQRQMRSGGHCAPSAP